MPMHLLRGIVLSSLAAGCLLAADFEFRAPAATLGRKRPVRARLVLSHEVAKPGDTVLAGVELTMDGGYHTYWLNPGLGEPTRIHMSPAPEISISGIQCPIQRNSVIATHTHYGYYSRA